MGLKVGDRVRIAGGRSGFPFGTVTAIDRNLRAAWPYRVLWDGDPAATWQTDSELLYALDETPVDVSAPSAEDAVADHYRRARDSWNSTVRFYPSGDDGRFSRRNLLIADLLVDAHTTADVLTILSEFRLI